MKQSAAKSSQPRKLVLRRETIASLERTELREIMGGVRGDTGSGAVCLTTAISNDCD
jgi:hypothetical protein